MPLGRIITRMAEKRFLRIGLNGKLRILYPEQFTLLPIKDMIIRYRSILFGYMNYFSFADNKHKLKIIHGILRASLIEAIGRKRQISRTKVVQKYGEDVTLKILRKDGETVFLDFKCPPISTTPCAFLGANAPKDPLSVVDWKISTIDNMGQNCANCDSPERVEMHHVKHIKTINPRLSPFDHLLARINRKQVPLCKSCHLKVHLGTYNGRPLRHFYYIPFQGAPK
jgi:hypothetical protein